MTGEPAPEPMIRRDLRPGDLGAIVAHHGAVYAAEYGLDSTFEAHVGASVAAAGVRGFPRRGEAHLDRRARTAVTPAASRSPTRATGSAAVRWFVLDPYLRGRGLGRRLIDELVARGRVSRLRRARARDLQRPARPPRTSTARTGSSCSGSRPAPRWGRDAAHLPALRAQLPGARPVLELGEHRLERAALLGQRVGDPGRRAVVDGALDQPGALELAQPPRQQPVREARDAIGQLGEVVRARRRAPRGSRRPSGGRSARSRRGNPGRTASRATVAAARSRARARAVRSRPPPCVPDDYANGSAGPASLAAIPTISFRLHMGRCPSARAYRRAPARRSRFGTPRPLAAAGPRRREHRRDHVAVQVDHRPARVAAADVGPERRHLAAAPARGRRSPRW